MLLRKTTLALFFVLLVFSSISAQEQNKQSQNTPNSNPQTTATPAASPAAPVTQVSPADDRLPFMAETAKETQDSAPSTGGLMLRTLGALILIVGLIVVAAWLLKRFGGTRFGKVAEDAPELSILNTVALGDKRSITIVRFGERTLLLGSTAQSITVLAETDDTTFPAPASVADMLGEQKSCTFADELSEAEQGGARAQW